MTRTASCLFLTWFTHFCFPHGLTDSVNFSLFDLLNLYQHMNRTLWVDGGRLIHLELVTSLHFNSGCPRMFIGNCRIFVLMISLLKFVNSFGEQNFANEVFSIKIDNGFRVCAVERFWVGAIKYWTFFHHFLLSSSDIDALKRLVLQPIKNFFRHTSLVVRKVTKSSS